MIIHWKELALEDYSDCITYLEEYFSFQQVLEFTHKINQTIAFIESNPLSFPNTEYKNVKQIIVIPQVTIFYTPGKKTIKILRVWNNKQNKNNINL